MLDVGSASPFILFLIFFWYWLRVWSCAVHIFSIVFSSLSTHSIVTTMRKPRTDSDWLPASGPWIGERKIAGMSFIVWILFLGFCPGGGTEITRWRTQRWLDPRQSHQIRSRKQQVSSLDPGPYLPPSASFPVMCPMFPSKVTTKLLASAQAVSHIYFREIIIHIYVCTHILCTHIMHSWCWTCGSIPD